MHMRSLIALSLAYASFAVQATEIYRWVDEKGKVHFSDSVPEKYKRSAAMMDSHRYELSEAQLREQADRASRSPVAPQSPAGTPSQAKQQAAGGTEEQANCETLRRQYLESQDCFGRFRNTNGSIKAEAFQHCTEVKDPSVKCGPIITERY